MAAAEPSPEAEQQLPAVEAVAAAVAAGSKAGSGRKRGALPGSGTLEGVVAAPARRRRSGSGEGVMGRRDGGQFVERGMLLAGECIVC